LVKNDRVTLRIVQVGREADGMVEVVRGLAAGERVVRQAQDGLTDGALVAESK
jgi:multidrug efflux pump subunit AcrA (membrane-fusion protein)